MKVYLKNLYGIKDGDKAYYRGQGGCFDFCCNKENASDLTKEEALHILEHADWYKKQFNASDMGIED